MRILGGYVSNGLLSVENDNWKTKLDKLKSVVNLWGSRDLSFIGRAMILNVLGATCFWHCHGNHCIWHLIYEGVYYSLLTSHRISSQKKISYSSCTYYITCILVFRNLLCNHTLSNSFPSFLSFLHLVLVYI